MFERLADDRVVVRLPRPDDAAALAAAFVEDRELGVLLGVEEDPTEAALRERFAEPVEPGARFRQFAIADPATDAAIGSLFVHSIDARHRRCEVGFFLVPAVRGAGLGTAAVRLALDWLFGEGGFLRVEMTTTPDNAAVPRLAAALGFRQEGTLRKRNVERGRRVDVVWFGLLREEHRRP